MRQTEYGVTPMRWQACLTMLALVGGCSVTGTWKRVTTDPPDAPFPVEDLLLDADGAYSAQWEYEGRKCRSQGTYEFRGGELIIAQNGSMPRAYGARVRLDGKLELTLAVNGDSVKAVLERQRPQKRQSAEQKEQLEATPGGNEAAPATPKDERNGNAGAASDQPQHRSGRPAMVLVAFSVTTTNLPSGEKPTCAGAVPAPLRGVLDPGSGLSCPWLSSHSADMVSSPAFTTYTRSP